MPNTTRLIGEVNELSSAILELTFTDENDQPVAPLSLTFRVDDVFTQTNYILNQTIVPSSPTVSLFINPSWNDIRDQNNETEYRRLTIDFIVSSARVGTSEFLWAVRNLRHI